MPGTLATNNDQAKKITAALEALGESRRGYESVASGIRDHEQTWYAKPENKTYEDMAEIATRAAEELREETQLVRIFNYRPWDGANALQVTLNQIYGYSGFGKATFSMFGGKQPPRRITIQTSYNTTIEVPWGRLELPDLQATLDLGMTRDLEKGMLFTLQVTTLKRNEKAISGLFVAIERTLETRSIYKGKAINGAEQPEFLDLSKVNPDEVIFQHNVQAALEAELWFPIENQDLIIADGQPRRWISLLAGDYGTGKTLACYLTGQRCEANGITFIQARPGKDDIKQVMSTAALYAPAVVAFEDVDVIANPQDTDSTGISMLLEAFDGVSSKGGSVSVIMTTNHQDRIHAGMVRAGRLHTYLVFEGLDAVALQKLITVKVGESRLEDLDMGKIFEACADFTPSFMDLVIQISKRYALTRHNRQLNDGASIQGKNGKDAFTTSERLAYRIGTEDLVNAAARLRPQWTLMMSAKDPETRISLEQQISKIVHTTITDQKYALVDSDGDQAFGDAILTPTAQ